MRSNDLNPACRRRRGFTVLELLAVILVITVLFTLVTVASVGFIAQAKEAATKTTLQKIQGILNRRISGFERFITEQDEIRRTKGQNPLTPIQRKDLFRQYFPMTAAEGGYNAGTFDLHEEVLYKMLTEGESFGVEEVDTDGFTAAEISDIDGDGNMEFVDAWDQPLRYYRWPTRLVKPGGDNDDITDSSDVVTNSAFDGDARQTAFIVLIPSAPSEESLDRDPDDPRGSIGTLNPSNYHDKDTWHAPLVVSAGPDQNLGLFEPGAVANSGHLAAIENAEAVQDNLSNLALAAGD
ncbi:type II secretion system protein [Stratiformator vulcanicus]|uniref:Type II secretion system protein G n=1 Tax=Stratiformator vulcanicus TaxID=2527980 RepID=A0A517R119_9PLAN|nr:type II secretion system protein [Stratiformator vulcanicus]QDT37534.1 hypothetical protein Pan189_19140 [Stratiformator vulcanicus]